MKVTDEQIIQAVWRSQVDKSARGSICKYVGERFAVESSGHIRYGQGLG